MLEVLGHVGDTGGSSHSELVVEGQSQRENVGLGQVLPVHSMKKKLRGHVAAVALLGMVLRVHGGHVAEVADLVVHLGATVGAGGGGFSLGGDVEGSA